MKLTLVSKLLITALIVGGIGFVLYSNKDKIAPPAEQKVGSNVPPPASLASLPGSTPGTPPVAADARPGCASEPEVRFYHWAWNAQAGLMLATGGKQATAESRMCKGKVNLRLIREDNVDTMQALMLKFAEGVKKGEANPADGAHFVAIMGDGSAAFLKGLNDRLKALGPDYVAQVVGSAGYSRGEDKFMGPPTWKANPQAARGGLVAGYLRDGDWNIALKWLGDNQIPNNPNDQVYDPDALNWVAANDYLDAGQKYVTGFCVDLKNVKSGKKEKRCVDGVVTWTPGDVTVAQEKGGLVSIVSTKEYRSQMPNVIIGHKKWMQANRDRVQGMLKAIFDAGDEIKASDEALKKASAVSAVVYGEKDAAYWHKYFSVVVEKDKQGLEVELGGSSVNNLADNQQLFGLVPGSSNLFAATYTVFAAIVKSQYPDVMPNWYPVEQILDTSYVQGLVTAEAPKTEADLPKFKEAAKVETVVSRRAWDIQFESGSAKFTRAAETELAALLNDLMIASGTLVEVHGHTDNQGNADKNMQLSEDRAFAVKQWLESQSSANFPKGRVKVFAHGQTQPLESNGSTGGRAKNRRVEIVLGTET